MSGNNKRIVIERHELSLDGTDDFLIRTAPQICSADALPEQSITGKQDVSIASGETSCFLACARAYEGLPVRRR